MVMRAQDSCNNSTPKGGRTCRQEQIRATELLRGKKPRCGGERGRFTISALLTLSTNDSLGPCGSLKLYGTRPSIPECVVQSSAATFKGIGS